MKKWPTFLQASKWAEVRVYNNVLNKVYKNKNVQRILENSLLSKHLQLHEGFIKVKAKMRTGAMIVPNLTDARG